MVLTLFHIIIYGIGAKIILRDYRSKGIMEFKKIHTDADIIDFMKQFAFFHDSCIKEIHYISGSFVTDCRSMHPVNSKRSLSIIFESQQAKCKTMELLFDKIAELHLVPEAGDYDCVIRGVFF